jgi:hypothetical protein
MSTTGPSNDHEARSHALVDYAEQLSGGVDALLIASGLMRASTLALAVSTYGVSIAFILDSVEPATGAAVRAFMSAMWKKPDMIEIGTGVWDQP